MAMCTTVSVALSQQQYEQMSKAIEAWRDVHVTLKRMEQISRTLIFEIFARPLTA